MTKSSLPTIDPETLPAVMQPYVRLAQRNMQLCTNFSMSPEMVSLWLTNNQKMFSQALQSTATGKKGEQPQKMLEQLQKNMSETGQSEAFVGLVQGLMQSQMQFLVDLAQTSMAVLSQGPAKMVEQIQQAASSTLSVPVPSEEEEPRSSSKPKSH